MPISYNLIISVVGSSALTSNKSLQRTFAPPRTFAAAKVRVASIAAELRRYVPMKTYPIRQDDGSLRGFEIASTWGRFGPLFRILSSVDGVSEVTRQRGNEDRVAFLFHGHKGVIHEPWGDNSRYWVGLLDAEASRNVDISPIQEAFNEYRGLTFV